MFFCPLQRKDGLVPGLRQGQAARKGEPLLRPPPAGRGSRGPPPSAKNCAAAARSSCVPIPWRRKAGETARTLHALRGEPHRAHDRVLDPRDKAAALAQRAHVLRRKEGQGAANSSGADVRRGQGGPHLQAGRAPPRAPGAESAPGQEEFAAHGDRRAAVLFADRVEERRVFAVDVQERAGRQRGSQRANTSARRSSETSRSRERKMCVRPAEA